MRWDSNISEVQIYRKHKWSDFKKQSTVTFIGKVEWLWEEKGCEDEDTKKFHGQILNLHRLKQFIEISATNFVQSLKFNFASTELPWDKRHVFLF